jgi:hypothetical protein
MDLDAEPALLKIEDERRQNGQLFVATPEERAKVKELATAGIPHTHICLMVKRGGYPISQETLYKHFREELDEGIIEANTMVAGSLFKLALSGNIAAICFWLKSRAKWRETDQKSALGNLTPEQVADAVRAAILAASMVTGGPDPLEPPSAGHTDTIDDETLWQRRDEQT